MSHLPGADVRAVLSVCQRSVQFRATDDDVTGDGRTLTGYAAVFGQATEISGYEGNFEETIVRGAFKRTLRDRMPVMQFDHGNDKRTGSVPIAAIQDLHEDDEGLFVRARMFDNEVVEPIRQAVAGRAIRGMSFKFRVSADRWLDGAGKRIADDELADLLADPGERGPVRREITEVQLFELGPVVFPAYEQTTVGVRGRRFDHNEVALRGVIAQFGLDPGCIRRHLAIFDATARQALAREIADTFPELAGLLAQRAAGQPDPDFTGRPVARSAGGGENGAGKAPTVHTNRQRLDDGSLKLGRVKKR
jgi:HK97 family phage prohead protease